MFSISTPYGGTAYVERLRPTGPAREVVRYLTDPCRNEAVGLQSIANMDTVDSDSQDHRRPSPNASPPFDSICGRLAAS